MYRLGFTETTLLLFYYFDNVLFLDSTLYRSSQNNLINWLYTTSGMYDKTILGNNFNFDPDSIRQSPVYHSYFSKLLEIAKHLKSYMMLIFHKIDEELLEYKEKFLTYINYNKKLNYQQHIFKFMSNKNVLIINNLGSLIKTQHESGNMNKIHQDYPDNIKSIQYFNNGYSFFNNGPDSNLLETASKLCIHLKDLDFDGAIISTGAYSWIFGDYIENVLQKEVYIIGGYLPYYFGIKTKRVSNNLMEKNTEYLIEVPDHMKPPGYENIEAGCYW